MAQVLITIVADLLPLINFLQHQSQATLVSSTYLWSNNGLQVSTDMASKALLERKKYTTEFFTEFSAKRNKTLLHHLMLNYLTHFSFSPLTSLGNPFETICLQQLK